MAEKIQIYYGEGKGKTTAALGIALQEAGMGKDVIIVQFLKGKECKDLCLIKKLEPQIKLFRFEKYDTPYMELTDEEKAEEITNIKNGINYVRKVLTTAQCDVLVVDELLALIDYDILSASEVRQLLLEKDSQMQLILTGRGKNLPEEISDLADNIYYISSIKEEKPLLTI